ncbi:hypothetical protein MIN45_P0616 [Methylomarinovum tepidoasis]|uniref:Uncharacterized protein n=1 Tax=Methylomarinovum tepidoasis TaxID=2840183 RepID=A0AAU9C8R3_9GAMM|nr:hypothetical protein [Methylomarinovum sp. IN45]BCX88247.1 hypothetical protein MIN45_P0616 [Methylomarinovum sp. IN45]
MTGWLAHKIDQTQTVFVSLLRLWTIPIVLGLSLASGFTTYYGMAGFITPWIAFIITVAVQSIVVICSLELASVHWRADPLRALAIGLSLLIALAVSVSFSYFKFYEIAHQSRLRTERLDQVRRQVEDWLAGLQQASGALLEKQRQAVARAEEEARAAYFGTHPVIPPRYRGLVGKGPFWRQYQAAADRQQARLQSLQQALEPVQAAIVRLQTLLGRLDGDRPDRNVYRQVMDRLHQLQVRFNAVSARFGGRTLAEPHLPPFSRITEKPQPSLAMWQSFSWFAFLCAAMVDLFTVLLSYRLELSVPAPMSEDEKHLALRLLTQFRGFRINRNGELELDLRQDPVARARRIDDGPRLFAIGLLLQRGLLRRVDRQRVEFAPGLYSLLAEELSRHLKKHRHKEKADTGEPS